MASVGIYKVNATEVMRTCTMQVRIVGLRMFGFRYRVFRALFWLACWVAPFKVDATFEDCE